MRVKLRSLQKSSSFNTEEEIEADPFGYILSPSILSAGIRNDKSARSPSPFWIKASSTSKISSFSSSDRPLVKVKRWILRIESWYIRRGGGRQHHHQDQTSNPAKSSIRADDDDEEEARSTSTTTRQVRGRSDARTSCANREDLRMMRSTPGRRQHLWRKPSESLWAVLEESEDVTP